MAYSKNIIRGKIAEVVNHLFQALLVTYLFLLLIEQIWTNSVSFYLNLNYLLIAVMVIGVLDVFSEHKKIHEKKANWKDYLLVIILGLSGFFIIKFKTFQLGWLSWLIAIVAAVLIILLSILVLDNDDSEELET